MPGPNRERRLQRRAQRAQRALDTPPATPAETPSAHRAKILYLHIGTEKTGSTTLQNFARVNHKALQAMGLHYPITQDGIKIHAALPAYASAVTGPPKLGRNYEIDGPESLERFRTDYETVLGTGLRQSGCQAMLLSNERLSAYIRRPAEIARLQSLAHALAEEVKIVIYLRDQPDMFLSAYSTGIKAGRDAEMRPPVKSGTYYYDYEQIIAAWAGVFGQSAMIVRVFDRRELVGGDIIDDFLAAIGMATSAGFERTPDINTRLDGRTTQFLRLFNRYVPRMVGAEVNPDRGRIAAMLAEISDGPRFSLSQEVVGAIHAAFAKSNARVAQEYFGREDGVLFRPSAYESVPHAPLTVEQAVEIAAKLWRAQLAETRNRVPVPVPDTEDDED